MSKPVYQSGDQQIAANETAASDLVTISHSIFIEGHAKQSAAAMGGSVCVDGTVDGDVAAFGGDVWLGPKASIGGDVTVLGGKLYASPDARILGRTLATTYFSEVYRQAFQTGRRPFWSLATDRGVMLWRVARLLGWFIIALLVILFVPVQATLAMDRFERDFARILLIGFVALIVFVGLLALFSILIKFIIGIPLIFLLLVSLIAMWGFGAVAFYLTLGRWLVRHILKRPVPMAIYALLGLILWSLLSFIPMVQLFVPYIVFIFALGISLATKFGTGKPWFTSPTEKPVVTVA
ncbi:MAG: hypothetical protein PHX83_04005 [Acidobacteriia bacterium]|nr:hypothetical protein [Terriglobia bacterium]